MKNIKELDRYQKFILTAMTAMFLLFTVLYAGAVFKKGYEYRRKVLARTEEGGSVLYSGKIEGQQACFTVSGNSTVTFRLGDTTYGPFEVRKDPSAIPSQNGMSREMTGIEVYEGGEILFRGGVLDRGDHFVLVSDNGNVVESTDPVFVSSQGYSLDENAEPTDIMKPTAAVIYELINDPQLIRKAEAAAWIGATLICILNACCILFADELFRLKLALSVRNAGEAEPSDLEIAGRYIAWTVLAAAALVVFIIGLR